MWRIGFLAALITILATASSAEGRCEECLEYEGPFASCLNMDVGYQSCTAEVGVRCWEEGEYGDCCDLPEPWMCPPPGGGGLLADGSIAPEASRQSTAVETIGNRSGSNILSCAGVIVHRQMTPSGLALLRASTSEIVI